MEWIFKKGGRNKIKEGEESRAKERDGIMHSDRMAFSLGNQENSTIHQTNMSNGSFHMANQALFSHKSLKALHRQWRELEDPLSRIRLYI